MEVARNKVNVKFLQEVRKSLNKKIILILMNVQVHLGKI